MAPVARRAQLFTNAYRLAKLSNAAEEFLEEVFSPKGGASPSSPSTSAPAAPGQQRQDGSLVQGFTAAYRRAQAAYGQQLTQQIMITGAAMAPTLNKAALSDPTAVERLVLRLLRRPSSRSVQVGDVVAFYSPLAPADAQHVMVRRVAAVEGQEMVSGSDEEQSFSIPRDHCWVLADNESLKANQVIDSRSFGHIPFGSILGRVIYAAASRHDHGPVPNNPDSVVSDAPVVEAEVHLESMFPDASDDEGDGGGSSSSGKK